MERAKKALKSVNVASYTSAFESTVPMPSEREIEKMKDMMEDLKPKVHAIKVLYKKLEEFLPMREKTLKLIEEAIEYLKSEHRNVNIAKVNSDTMRNAQVTH